MAPITQRASRTTKPAVHWRASSRCCWYWRTRWLPTHVVERSGRRGGLFEGRLSCGCHIERNPRRGRERLAAKLQQTAVLSESESGIDQTCRKHLAAGVELGHPVVVGRPGERD